MPADQRTRPHFLALLFSLIPGLGHLVLGRARRGFFLFLAATFCWNLALLSRLVPVYPLGTWSARLGQVVGAAVHLYALVDIFRLGVYARLPRIAARRREIFERALTFYLRQEFAAARELLDRILDLDPGDPLVRLYLATLERRAGRPDRAIHHARAALGSSPSHPFRPEIERELMLAQEARRGR